MAKKKQKLDQQEELASKIDALRPFVQAKATAHMPLNRLLSTCLVASLVRAFDFVELSMRQSPETAFYLAPGLRGIAEDIIFLRYISRISREDREKLIGNLMRYEVATKLKEQYAFFRVFRPFQPILQPTTVDLKAARDEIRAIWHANGWPNLNRGVNPPTREIALRSDPGLLEVLYDFIYRMTSGLVHFNPQVLLRSGWGPSPKKTTFSSKNMGPYYLSFCRIYGAFLLCLYFEFFGAFLRPDKKVKDAVTDLREQLLLIFRWPEMVTFEEMNVSVPKPKLHPTTVIFAAYTVMLREGFIRGGKDRPLDWSKQTE